MTSHSEGRPLEPQPPDADARPQPPGRRIAAFGRPPGQGFDPNARPASRRLRPGARPDRSLASRPRPVPPPYGQPFVLNPYLAAGCAVAIGIIVAIMYVVVSGGGGGAERSDSPGVIVSPLTPIPGRGIAARSISPATVRLGPGLDYDAMGELARNQDVEVAGRNADATWFAIYFPPGSQLRGWVAASALRLPADPGSVPIANVTPLPRPTVLQPTLPPEPSQTATTTPTATGTPTPSVGPDLVATIVPGTCQVGARLIVSVRNTGPAPIVSRAITVLVQAADGTQRASKSQAATLQAGETIDIDTGYVVQERVIAVVDPLMTLGDPNLANNRVDCVVAATPPVGRTATPTRTATSIAIVTPTLAP